MSNFFVVFVHFCLNTISGGFARGDATASVRKHHLRSIQFVNVISRKYRCRRMLPITFTYANFQGINPSQVDSMVITIEVENFVVKKVLVDQGSSVDILYWKHINSCNYWKT